MPLRTTTTLPFGVWTVILGPLRPLITPWTCALCATAVLTPSASTTRIASALTAVLNFNLMFMFLLPFLLSRLMLAVANRCPGDSSIARIGSRAVSGGYQPLSERDSRLGTVKMVRHLDTSRTGRGSGTHSSGDSALSNILRASVAPERGFSPGA